MKVSLGDYARGWQSNVNNEAAYLLDYLSSLENADGGKVADWYTYEVRVLRSWDMYRSSICWFCFGFWLKLSVFCAA